MLSYVSLKIIYHILQNLPVPTVMDTWTVSKLEEWQMPEHVIVKFKGKLYFI